ncbi:hypothetical protein F7984_04995 [Pradoshia sp. D12]|uniref:hypothetical protein n=1 Tax=Bacillaceae TaxID=186817 RepID=UPI00111F831E|nr:MULTISPECIES: hypothetical protein [Bacillaceae]QFK70643.1 hypothetical protein F7984_04995 [Pradoshia sp. D12]TPF72438.1 hypothetical protein FHY44_01390 [Bacillus sp. D12]
MVNNIKTIDEWIADNHLNPTEVGFIETILTFASTVRHLQHKKTAMNEAIRTMFPDKRAEITPKITYQKLEKILIDNDISIDLETMLNQYLSQGVCVDLCNELLLDRG